MHDIPHPEKPVGLHRNVRRLLGGCLVTLCLFFVVVYVASWVLMTQYQEEARRSVGWPTVPGVVTSHEVEMLRGVHPDDVRPTRGARGAYLAGVTYIYTVAGEDRVGDRLRVGITKHATEEEARAELEPFPVGAEVAVHVDPEDPRSAVLVPGPTEFDNTYFHAYGGGFLAMFVVLALVVRAIARAEPAPTSGAPDGVPARRDSRNEG